MPKKSSSGRSGSQRQRTRAQKGIELVRPISEEDKAEAVEEQQQVKESVATATATPETSKPESSTPDREATETPEPVETSKREPESRHEPEADSGSRSRSRSKQSSASLPTSTSSETVSSKAGSASARIAAKRQATQRAPRSVSLITAEHFSYVRRDLIFIGILAVIMIAAIIILYLVLGK